MEDNLLRNIITSFNKSTFSKFIYELWHFKDSIEGNETIKTYYLPKMGENLFEHYHTLYTTVDKALIEQQIFTLIIPFFYPSEVFNHLDKITDSQLSQYLKKYKQTVDKRHSSWQWWIDGNYYVPNVAFVSNYSEIDFNSYLDKIFPLFERFIDRANLDAQVAIGTVDSFLELEKKSTEKVLIEFIKKHKSEIVISFNEDIAVNEFISQKYLTNGVLKNSFDLCEPVFQLKSKNEIIKEFEYLINHNSSEAQLEAFLKKYFMEFFKEYDRIETQIWLKFKDLDIGGKDRRLDMFLRNAVSRDWELFELKKVTPLTHTYRDISVFTQEVHNGIEQIRAYKYLLSQDRVRKSLALQGIEYYEPEYRLIIGRDPDISPQQWRHLKKSNEHDLKINTYDDILKEMKVRSNYLIL